MPSDYRYYCCFILAFVRMDCIRCGSPQTQASPYVSPPRRVDVSQMDRWCSFPAEREVVLAIAKRANNAVFYGGDTHNDWAAVAVDAAGDVVAAEFDTAAVTAPGIEDQAFMLPPDFISAVQVAGGCPTHRVVAVARAVLPWLVDGS